MCEKKCNCTCNGDEMTIKKSVYNHLIKTTNVVRTRNRQLEEENRQLEEENKKLLKQISQMEVYK